MNKLESNYLMLWITTLVVALSGVVYILHRVFGVFQDYVMLLGVQTLSGGLKITFLILAFVTVGLLIASWVLYKINKEHRLLKISMTLALTHASMLIIASGDGLVEYHFSIFMVLALITFFNSIPMILISASIFAVHHFAGYFLFPELLCGTSDYRFSLLMIHAVFLILTSGANIILTLYRNRMRQEVDQVRKESEESFQLIVTELTTTMENLKNVTESVKSGSEESRTASEEIASSIETLSKGSAGQLEQAEMNATHLVSMIGTISSLNQSAVLVFKEVTETTELATKGEQLIDQTTEQFRTVSEGIGHLEQLVQNFQHRVNDIHRFVNDITEIADQTNLLSLNASIEAARAGEAGKGFAIVANEVRKLALQSEQSASSVSHVVNEITKESAEIFREIAGNVTEVTKGMSSLQTTNHAFTNIQQATSSIQQQMDHVSSMIETINVSSEDIYESMDHLKVISNEGLVESQEIASAAEQQWASTESLTMSTRRLQSLTESIEKLVQQIN